LPSWQSRDAFWKGWITGCDCPKRWIPLGWVISEPLKNNGTT